ncbi:MAG: metallophosphoesterase [Phycisphaeraceae bacterium]
MKLGVISDTHDRLPTFARALERFQENQVEAIFHAGDLVAPFAAKLIAKDQIDVPVYCIYGNNDGERAGLKKVLPQIQDGPLSVRLGGRRIVMHHALDWLSQTDIAPADIVISGHNHEVSSRIIDEKLYLNPGECCGWLTGRCTAAILHVENLQTEILDIPAD